MKQQFRYFSFQCLLALFLIVNLAPVFGQDSQHQLQIKIMEPKDKTDVVERPTIHGTVSDTQAKVWLIVHPLKGSTYWVQPAISVDAKGKWQAMPYIGSGVQGVGEQFEIIAIANPKKELSEGDKLTAEPRADVKHLITVTRR